jgi:hypothetical protein
MVLVHVAHRPDCHLRVLVDNSRRYSVERTLFCTVVRISATKIDSLSMSMTEMLDVPVETERMYSDAESDGRSVAVALVDWVLCLCHVWSEARTAHPHVVDVSLNRDWCPFLVNACAAVDVEVRMEVDRLVKESESNELVSVCEVDEWVKLFVVEVSRKAKDRHRSVPRTDRFPVVNVVVTDASMIWSDAVLAKDNHSHHEDNHLEGPADSDGRDHHRNIRKRLRMPSALVFVVDDKMSDNISRQVRVAMEFVLYDDEANRGVHPDTGVVVEPNAVMVKHFFDENVL